VAQQDAGAGCLRLVAPLRGRGGGGEGDATATADSGDTCGTSQWSRVEEENFWFFCTEREATECERR